MLVVTSDNYTLEWTRFCFAYLRWTNFVFGAVNSLRELSATKQVQGMDQE